MADYFNQNKEKLLCNNNIIENMNRQSETQNSNSEVIVVNDNSAKMPVTENTFKKPQELLYPDFPGVTILAEMSEFDKLWMCLFTKLGKQLL